MGENYLSIVGHFFSHFIKNTLFGRDVSWGVFKLTKFESFVVIELGPFWEAPGPFLAHNVALSREQLAIQAWRSRRRVSHLNCSKRWCPFAKILKSSKLGENAFTKGFFPVILLKSPDSAETVSTAVFEVVEFTSVVKIDLGTFLGDVGIIFAQRLGLS